MSHEHAPPPATTERFYAPEIDGLRFAAALLVLLHHAPPLPFLGPLQSIGWAGVDLFLCISAYLLVRLLRMEVERAGTLDLRKFFVRRILRIWPLYFGYAAVMSIAAIWFFDISTRVSVGWLLSHLSFSANLLTAAHGVSPIPFTTHLWTISLEEQAYFLMPFLLLAMVRSKPSMRTVVAILALASAVLALGRVALYLAGLGPDFILRLLFRADPLIIGGAIALFHEQVRAISRRWLAFAILMSTIFLGLGPQWAILAFYPLVALLCASILLLVQRVPLLTATFSTPPLAYLGKISYGLYVYHLLGLSVAGKLFAGSAVLETVCGLSLTVIAAILSYHLYEAPFLRLKKRFTIVQSRPV